MHIIREKQKLIYWIVAILTIPTFIIFFGGGSSFLQEDPNAGVPVARIDGGTVSWGEFNGFRQRMNAVCPNLQVLLTQYQGGMYMPMRNPLDNNGYFSALVAMACNHEAQKAGLLTTDEEVGTYLRSLPALTSAKDEDAFQKQFLNYAKQYNLTRKDLMRGVREYLQMAKFLELLDGTALVTDETARLAQLRGQIQLAYDSIRVSVSDFDAKAKADYDAQTEAAREARVADYYAKNADDDVRFWTKPRWSFEYVYAPFDVEGLVPGVTDAEIEAYYEKNREQYRKPETDREKAAREAAEKAKEEKAKAEAEKAKKRKGKDAAKDAEETPEAKPEEKPQPQYRPLEEVRLEIRERLVKDKKRMVAVQTLDQNLTNVMTQQMEKTESAKVELQALAESVTLQKRGAKTGVLAAEPIEAEGFVTLEPVAGSADLMAACGRIASQLRMLQRAMEEAKDADAKAKAKEQYDELWNRLTTDFWGTEDYQGKEQALEAGSGLFRLRLAKYVPGVKRPLKDAAGKTDPELLALVEKALLSTDAQRLSSDRAEEIRVALASGKLPEGVAPEAKTVGFAERGAEDLQLAQKGVATVRKSAGGFEVVRLTGRAIPADTASAEEKAMLRMRQKYLVRGNLRYQPGVPMGIYGGYVIAGPRLQMWLNEAMVDKRFEMLEPLLASMRGGEGGEE